SITIFFFSSRRRHTRSKRDWSSDVCSSDLMEGITSLLPLIAIIAVFYFFMIRPQMKQRKNEQKFSESLKTGDKVVTKSGMYGRVLALNDKNDTVVLETGAGKITFDRSAISLEMSQKRTKAEQA